MERRTFLKGSAASLAVTGLTVPFIRKARAELTIDRSQLSKTLRFSSYGGDWQQNLTEAAIRPFEEKYGVQVIQESHGGEAELIAKMKAAGPGVYDVVTVNESGLYLGVVQDVFEELRLDKIPNYKNVVQVLQRPPYDPGPGIHSVPDVYGSSAIVYNSNHVAAPTGWDVAWNADYKGRIALRDSAVYRVFLTALYVGQNPNDITDIDEIYAALREQRPLMLKYFGGVAEARSLLANEEAWIADYDGGGASALKRQGLPIEYLAPEEGVRGWVDCVAIGKGSANRYTAEVFLNHLLDPEIAVRIAELTYYPHCLDANKTPSSSVLESLPEYDPSGTLSRFIFTDYAYMERHRQTWEAEWTKIKLGG